MGAMGTVQNERKLGYFEVVLSGHMVPQFSPKVRPTDPRSLRLREVDCSLFDQAAFQSMQWLFGIRENP